MFTRKDSCWKLIKLVVRKYDIPTTPLAHEARRATNREGGEEMMRRRLFQIMSWTAASFMLIAHIGIPEAHADGTWKFKSFDTYGNHALKAAVFTGDALRNGMLIKSVEVGGVPMIRVNGTGSPTTVIDVDGVPFGFVDLDTTYKKIVVKGRGDNDTINVGYVSQSDLEITIKAGEGNFDSVRLNAMNVTGDSEISKLILAGGPGNKDILMVESAFKFKVGLSSIGGFEILQQ